MEKITYLMVQPDAGLGNRLNCIYSGLYYRDDYKTKLHILWLRENCCNVPFRELFEVPDNTRIHTIYNLGFRNKYAFVSVLSRIYMSILKKRVVYLDAGQTRRLYEGLGEEEVRKVQGKTGKSCLMSSGPFCTDEHFTMAHNSLRPTKEILARVDEIMAPYKGREIYGVHIRRTDHQIAIANSPLEDFYKVMDECGKDAVFYFATDDMSLYEDFEKKYTLIPHINYSDEVSRSSTAGMKDAYVDMLCLSRCRKIYGSYGSTFSMLASYIGGAPRIVVGNGDLSKE